MSLDYQPWFDSHAQVIDLDALRADERRGSRRDHLRDALAFLAGRGLLEVEHLVEARLQQQQLS